MLMMPCANCSKVLTSLPDDDGIINDAEDCCIMLQGIGTVENNMFGDDEQRKHDIPISEVLSTVFEAYLKLNQKQLSSGCDLRMCFLCLSSLISLNEAYSKFLKLTKDGSFVQQLLETSILWSSYAAPQNSELVQEENFLPVEVKLETDGDEINIVTIKAEELDFGLDGYPAPSTSSGTDDVPPIDATKTTRIKRLKDIQRKFKHIRKTATSSRTETMSGSTKVEKKKVIKKYQCTGPGCTISFNDKNLFRRHVKFKHGNATPEEMAKRTCNECPTPRVFGLPYQLRRHQLRVHQTEPTLPVKQPLLCPHKCKTLFHSKPSLRLHLKSVHPELSTFTCETCGKKFKGGVNYRRHLKFKHFQGLTADDLEGRTCNICNKIFGTKSEASSHQKSVHTTEKPFKCEVEGCGKTFPTKNYMQIHQAARHKPENNSYQCEQCGKSLTTKGSLQLHMRVVHEGIRTAVCHLCGLACARSSDLNQHLKTHDKTREKRVECSICNRRFHNKGALNKHTISTHSGVRHHCTHCNDSFSDVGNLKRHLAAKHGIRPEKGPDSKESHECKQCGKVFTLKDYLTQHLRSKSHGGKGHWAHSRDGIGSTFFKPSQSQLLIGSTEDEPSHPVNSGLACPPAPTLLTT